MAVCEMIVKIKISYWVNPLVRFLAICEHLIPASVDVEKLANFIIKHGIKYDKNIRTVRR